MIMRRFSFVWMAAGLTALGISGCATKNYVRTQTAPIVQHAGQLDTQARNNNRQIQDVNQRAQAGIQKAQGAADTANQSAQNATQQASTAQNTANDAVNRADTLGSVVKGLDNYKQQADVSVHFAFNKSVLTANDKQQLDSFAAQLQSSNSYILEVTGGTDSSGPSLYNDELSDRRADAVVQYLATKYNVPARRFYLIGIGKDEYVAPNSTAAGRKENRRVEVQMLTNMPSESAQANQPAQPQGAQQAPPMNNQAQPSQYQVQPDNSQQQNPGTQQQVPAQQPQPQPQPHQ
ncbi:MAG: OmpA family protein [Terracidiphilus sp.]